MGRLFGGSDAVDTAALDCYQILQVDPDAPPELVVEAYWHLIRRTQDGRTDKRSVRDRIDDLNEAYATLISTERRKAHDLASPRVAKLRLERARAARRAGKRRFIFGPARRRRAGESRVRRDYYAVLCLDPSAEPAIVDRAYTVLRVLQSDGLAASPGELAEAHALLSDPDSRAAYDASPAAAPVPEVSPAADALTVAAPIGMPAASAGEAESSGSALAAMAAVAGATGRAVWRGLVGGAHRSRRFAAWAWPIVRVRSRQFVAWAWPIIRTGSRWLAVHVWLATRAAARVLGRAIRETVRRVAILWQERRGGAEPGEDPAVRSRLSREVAGAVESGWQTDEQRQDAMPQPRARLTVERGPKAGVFVELEGEPVTVGAAEKCDLRLAGDGVEAEHARIWPRQGRFIIRQLGDQPCISVDGRTVPWAVLEDGDRIEIGPHVVLFQLAGRENGTRVGLAAAVESESEG